MPPITIEQIKQNISDFIRDSFLHEIGQEGIEGDTNLFESGVMDSYSLVELVSFIEKTYEIDIDNSEITAPDLTTYDGIVSFIDRKVQMKTA